MMVCVETLCQIDEVIGRKPSRHPDQPSVRQLPVRALNAERYLRSPKELCDLFEDQLQLVENTLRVVDLCESNVLPQRAQLPIFCENEELRLEQLVYQRAKELPKYQMRASRLKEELACINSRGFAGHFLVTWDMCRWAKEQGIVLSGRGSVVDSAVAYCLGLSRIDAFEHNLYFERFLPSDGSKRPDIDIDFEARRRRRCKKLPFQ